MEVNSVGPIRPSSPFPFETDKNKTEDVTFGEALKQAVQYVDNLQNKADDMSLKLALGEIKDPHEVMLAVEKATMSLQLTVEIRNRVIDAYQNIMRMAV
jgi:flagellar hook-basal body complex protein FliE